MHAATSRLVSAAAATSLLLAGFLSNTTSAATPMTILEDAKETSTSEVTLPSSDSGALYFKNCQPCNQSPIRLSSSSKFLLGSTQVDFATFKKAAEANNHFLLVFYDPKSRVVTRLKL